MMIGINPFSGAKTSAKSRDRLGSRRVDLYLFCLTSRRDVTCGWIDHLKIDLYVTGSIRVLLAHKSKDKELIPIKLKAYVSLTERGKMKCPDQQLSWRTVSSIKITPICNFHLFNRGML
jgi:hypothetical protein